MTELNQNICALICGIIVGIFIIYIPRNNIVIVNK
jgi:hypothetical protein